MVSGVTSKATAARFGWISASVELARHGDGESLRLKWVELNRFAAGNAVCSDEPWRRLGCDRLRAIGQHVPIVSGGLEGIPPGHHLPILSIRSWIACSTAS